MVYTFTAESAKSLFEDKLVCQSVGARIGETDFPQKNVVEACRKRGARHRQHKAERVILHGNRGFQRQGQKADIFVMAAVKLAIRRRLTLRFTGSAGSGVMHVLSAADRTKNAVRSSSFRLLQRRGAGTLFASFRAR